MIIKSLSRKAGWRTGKGSKKGTNTTSAFGSLVAYMNRADKDERIKEVLWHNFYGDERTLADDIRRTFEFNAAHLKERKNGNVLYHEILSFSSGHRLDDATLDRIIADIGQAYLNERAANQLAYGVIHKDTEHIHLHLMISANNVDKADRVRLSKAEFAEIQKRVESYVLEKYPELEQTKIYAKAQNQEKLKTQAHEQAMKSRTGKTSRKEQMKAQLHQMFERAQSYDELAKLIQAAGIEMYQRGKSVGVVVRDLDGTERRHRLSSLGVLEHYERTNARLSGQSQEKSTKTQQNHQAKAQDQQERTKPNDAFERQPTEAEKQFDAFARGKPSDTTKESEQARRIRELREARDAQEKGEAADREQGRGQDDDIGQERWNHPIFTNSTWLVLPTEYHSYLLHYSNPMNVQQAKTIELINYLERLGFTPQSRRWNDVWYTSPFRPNERTASFKIDNHKNLWFDHWLGQGGTIIEFVQHFYQTNNVSRVLALIAETSGGVARAAEAKFERELTRYMQDKPAPELESLTPITDKRLIDYIEKRAIPLDLARQYVQEATYRVGLRSYKALAFANDAGGFEVRNARFQGTIWHKDITFLPKPDRQDVAIFEGFFDFLSTLVYYGQSQPNANVLVLNSVSMIDRAIDKLKRQGIHTLYAYLDHDAAGETTKSHLAAQAHQFHVQNASKFYHGHKDANDMLMAAREWYYRDLPYDALRQRFQSGDTAADIESLRQMAREYSRQQEYTRGHHDDERDRP